MFYFEKGDSLFIYLLKTKRIVLNIGTRLLGSHMRWGKAGVKDQHHIIQLFESRKTPAWETVQTVDELNALQTGKGQRVIVGLFYPDFDSEEVL